MSITTTIHSRDIVAMAKRSLVEGTLSAKALGWEIIGAVIAEADTDEAERLAGMAWEQGDDYHLGLRAIAALRRMNETRRHCLLRVTLEKAPPLPRRRGGR
jgi:hypothetical protein